MPKNVLGTKLKKLRKERNLTQNKLSQKLGFSERYIAKIESGVRPSIETYKKLADFFELPVEYLVSDNEKAPLTILVQNEELLNAFMEVDRMSAEDQKIVLELIKAFIAKMNSVQHN
jgi:transcriptional regulator with XRE-family HTH domain